MLQKLQEAVRCWHNFRENERVISEWLQKAEKLIAEKHMDTKQTVESHKVNVSHYSDRCHCKHTNHIGSFSS